MLASWVFPNLYVSNREESINAAYEFCAVSADPSFSVSRAVCNKSIGLGCTAQNIPLVAKMRKVRSSSATCRARADRAIPSVFRRAMELKTGLPAGTSAIAQTSEEMESATTHSCSIGGSKLSKFSRAAACRPQFGRTAMSGAFVLFWGGSEIPSNVAEE